MPAEALGISSVGGRQDLSFRSDATSGSFRMRLPSSYPVDEPLLQVLASFRDLHEMLYSNSTSTLTFSQEEQDQVNQILELYDVPHRQDVESFLLDRKRLVEIVVQAYSQVVLYFGDNPRVTLSVDPGDYADEPPELWAEIHTSMSVDEADDLLDELKENWYYDQAHWLIGTFNITLEFA